MKKLFTSAVLALIISIHASAQEKIYFDENWEKTTQNKMEYYRETESKGKLTLIRDYYKNGTLQMEGLVSDATPGSEVFEGKITWYNPEGKVLSIGTFSGGNQIGPAKTYDEQGRILEDLTYKADGTFTGKIYMYKNPEEMSYNNTVTTYDTPDNFKSVVYDEDIKGIRYEIITDNKKGSYETKFYGEKGKYIGSNNSGNSGDNVTVEYYYDPMKVAKIEKQNKDGIVTESVIYSKKGGILQEEKKSKKDAYKKTYDETGKQIGNLTYVYEKENDFYRPFEGDDYQFNYLFSGFTSIDTYKNGAAVLKKIFDEDGKLSYDRILKDEMTQEIKYYDPDGKLKGAITYKDDMPDTGTIYEGLIEQQYKDGILVNSKSFRENGKLKKETKINKDQTVYNSTVYDENGAVAYTYSQPVDQESGFTAQIVQYAKGKAANKASVKDGVLQSGKIKYKCLHGLKELERNGKWVLIKLFSQEGKLIQESKVLAEMEEEQDPYNSLNTLITEDDLQYEFYETL